MDTQTITKPLDLFLKDIEELLRSTGKIKESDTVTYGKFDGKKEKVSIKIQTVLTKEQFLQTSIVDIQQYLHEYDTAFSVRVYNGLRSAGVETINDILSFNPEELRKKAKNIGQGSIDEISYFLKKYGIEW